VFRLLVTANVVPISPILLILIMDAMSSSEMSVLTQLNIPEDGILHLLICTANRLLTTPTELTRLLHICEKYICVDVIMLCKTTKKLFWNYLSADKNRSLLAYSCLLPYYPDT
jgi:hypothetical protein